MIHSFVIDNGEEEFRMPNDPNMLKRKKREQTEGFERMLIARRSPIVGRPLMMKNKQAKEDQHERKIRQQQLARR